MKHSPVLIVLLVALHLPVSAQQATPQAANISPLAPARASLRTAKTHGWQRNGDCAMTSLPVTAS